MSLECPAMLEMLKNDFFDRVTSIFCKQHFKILNISTDREEWNFKSTVTTLFLLIKTSYHCLLLQNKFIIFWCI